MINLIGLEKNNELGIVFIYVNGVIVGEVSLDEVEDFFKDPQEIEIFLKNYL